MTVKFNRGWLVVTAILAGLLIGLFAGAYIIFAWVPAEMVLKDSPPRTLAFDGASPQYRDMYVARVAARFQALGGGASDAALQEARDLLGVTTGDATNEEAGALAKGAADVARNENTRDGNGGRFTQDDELAMRTLADRLGSAPPFNSGNASRTAPQAARAQSQIIGFIILVVLVVIGFGAVFLVDRRVGSMHLAHYREQAALRGGVAVPGEPGPVPAAGMAAAPYQPLSPAAPPPTVAAPIPAVPAGVAVAVAAPIAAPIAGARANEVILASFPPCNYAHGDDRFDEDFAINGPMGELLGECGASIADRLGLDSPARVTALAVWVFDKNDFQSTTKVLMTDFAYNDVTIKSKLMARGEPVLAVDNGRIEVLTSTLRVEIEVTGLLFNTDNNPPKGYFQKVTLSYRVFKRQAA